MTGNVPNSAGSAAFWAQRVSRRRLLGAGLASAAGLAALYTLGCGDEGPAAAPTPTPATGAAPQPAADRTAVWRRLEPRGSLPPARADHSLTADATGSRAYLFGGRTGGEALNDLWAYDVDAAAWTSLTPAGEAPAARFGHNAAYDPAAERLLVFGGQAGQRFFSDVWAYDVRGNAWRRLAGEGEGPRARYGAGGAYDPRAGVLYVTHGFTTSGRFDDTWAFAPASAAWAEASPSGGARPLKRCLLRTTADPDRGRLLLFGGQSDSEPFLGDLWAFDTAGRGWRRLDAAGPSPRNLYAAVRCEGRPRLLLFGGRTEAGDSDELWELDLERDAWSPVAARDGAPAARSSHDAAWLPGRDVVLVFGGRSGESDLDELWQLTYA